MGVPTFFCEPWNEWAISRLVQSACQKNEKDDDLRHAESNFETFMLINI